MTRSPLRLTLAIAALLGVGLIAASSASADGYWGGAKYRSQYLMDISYSDVASWDRKLETDCEVSESHGDQTIESNTYTPAASPLTSRGKANYVSFTQFGNGNWLFMGYQRKDSAQSEKIWQPATLTVNNTDSYQNKGCDPEDVIICPDCNSSEPPRQQCGVYKGSITFDGIGSNFGPYPKNTALLNADPEIDDPFNPEDGKTFCNNNAFSPWPGVMALDENSSHFEVTRSKAFSYFRLGKKDQAACRKLEPEFARSPDQQKKANRCKANFDIKIKSVKNQQSPAPDYVNDRQESVIILKFYFRGICLKNQCRFKDNWNKSKPTMPGNPYRWGY